MIYAVRHVTTFRYQPAVRESVMEVRMQPRSEGPQRCLSFNLDVVPGASIMSYRDFLGNSIHHFDIAGAHSEVKVTAQAMVEVLPARPPSSAEGGDWQDLDALLAADDHWEMLLPSTFARPSALLEGFAQELALERRGSPLSVLLGINQAIHQRFSYVKDSTEVNSPIDDALRSRQGVCQDFAHIMIAAVRRLRIPCRYVSGYLYHTDGTKDRSSEGASHAWVEALLPRLGWIGFDPTNNLLGGERHIRVAIGRDYADVPPTRGVYKGEAESELGVSVTVTPSDEPPVEDLVAPSRVVRSQTNRFEDAVRSQYQEQQQQ